MVFVQTVSFIFTETKQILSDFIMGVSLPICFIPPDKPYELIAALLLLIAVFGPMH